MENHFLFVGLFDWENAETQTSSISRSRDGFALAESRTRKCGTVTLLIETHVHLFLWNNTDILTLILILKLITIINQY